MIRNILTSLFKPHQVLRAGINQQKFSTSPKDNKQENKQT
jgi:hypothetical protein